MLPPTPKLILCNVLFFSPGELSNLLLNMPRLQLERIHCRGHGDDRRTTAKDGLILAKEGDPQSVIKEKAMTTYPLTRLVFLAGLATGTMVVTASPVRPDQPVSANICSVRIAGKQVRLESPVFAFVLDTRDNLRAVSWENRLTGRKLALGNGAELELDIGIPGQPMRTPKMRVTKWPSVPLTLTPLPRGERGKGEGPRSDPITVNKQSDYG
jgi:hypothetical protein